MINLRKIVLELSKKIPDRMFLKIRFKQRMGRKLDLKNPKTFNEKVQWLKLYDRKKFYSNLVDKFEVRKVVEERIGQEYLIRLVGGPWHSFDEIEFSQLPDSFVLKCTHDSGGLVICKDKNELNLQYAKDKIQKSLDTNYYWHSREWPYKNVEPRIIAEEYMEDGKTKELRDYKFYCFNGIPKLMMIVTNRGEGTTRADYYDMEFQHQEFTWGYPMADIQPEKPVCFELMKNLAIKLSQGLPEIRVDFYEVDGHVYFGELTFFDGSGMQKIEPKEWDIKMGEWIVLPNLLLSQKI